MNLYEVKTMCGFPVRERTTSVVASTMESALALFKQKYPGLAVMSVGFNSDNVLIEDKENV